MKLFCKHDWKMISETTTKSDMEVAVATPNLKTAKGFDTQRKLIQIVACNKCGKLERFVEWL